MTSIVQAKFNEGKALFEGGASALLPLLKAVQNGEDITGNSAEYKALVKAIDGLNSGGEDAEEKAVGTNDDGLIKGQIVSEKDYLAIINKQRAKK